MSDRASTILDGHRERLARNLGRPLPPPPEPEDPLDEGARSFLLDEARDLYVNELEWERLMDEESADGEPLTELVFPGLLAFVRGLLLTEVMPDALAPARPRPEVVAELLSWLASRLVELDDELAEVDGESEEEEKLAVTREMTARLLDLVLYRYHRLEAGDVERVEAARAG